MEKGCFPFTLAMKKELKLKVKICCFRNIEKNIILRHFKLIIIQYFKEYPNPKGHLEELVHIEAFSKKERSVVCRRY